MAKFMFTPEKDTDNHLPTDKPIDWRKVAARYRHEADIAAKHMADAHHRDQGHYYAIAAMCKIHAAAIEDGLS